MPQAWEFLMCAQYVVAYGESRWQAIWIVATFTNQGADFTCAYFGRYY